MELNRQSGLFLLVLVFSTIAGAQTTAHTDCYSGGPGVVNCTTTVYPNYAATDDRPGQPGIIWQLVAAHQAHKAQKAQKLKDAVAAYDTCVDMWNRNSAEELFKAQQDCSALLPKGKQ